LSQVSVAGGFPPTDVQVKLRTLPA